MEPRFPIPTSQITMLPQSQEQSKFWEATQPSQAVIFQTIPHPLTVEESTTKEADSHYRIQISTTTLQKQVPISTWIKEAYPAI